MASPFAVPPPRALDEALEAWERVSDAVDDTGAGTNARARDETESAASSERDVFFCSSAKLMTDDERDARAGVELAADAQTLVKSIVTYARDGRWRRDKRVRASAEACARRASAKSETFRETLVLGASRAVTSGAFGDDECESLSRMVCLVLEEVERVGDGSAATRALETLAKTRARGERAFSSKAFRRAIGAKGCENALGRYFELVKSNSTVSPVVCSLVSDAYAVAKLTSSDAGSTRKELLEVFCAVVLGGDAKVAKAGITCETFASVLSDISEEETRDIVIPKIVRQLRRSPEAVLPSVLGCLNTLGADLSAACAEIGPVILPLAKHANEDRRSISLKVLNALVNKSSDPTHLREHVFKPCVDEFSTGKAPKEWNARAGLYGVVESCAYVSDRKVRESMSTEAIDALALQLKSEKQLDAKAAGLTAMTAWLGHAIECPESLVILIKEISKDAAERSSTLQCVARAVGANSVLPRGLSSVIAILTPIAIAGSAKPALRNEGLSALSIILSVAAEDSAVAEAVKSSKVWESVPAYFELATMMRFDAVSGQILSATAQCVLSSHGCQATKLDFVDSAIQAMALMSLHPDPKTRAKAREAVRGAVAVGQPATKMLRGLQHWLAQVESGVWDAANWQDSDNGAFPSRYAGATLLSYCEFDEDSREVRLPDELIGEMILLAHHPLVAAPDGRRAGAWNALLARLGGTIEVTEGAAVCRVIMDERGLSSTSTMERIAARKAVAALGRLAADEVLKTILPHVLAMLDIDAHNGVSEKEILIFNTAPGSLSTDPVDRPVAAQPQQLKKESGVVSLRPSQVAAGAKASTKPSTKVVDPREAARRVQLADEESIRMRVKDVANKLVDGLEILTAVLEGLGHRARDHVCDIAHGSVFPLLGSKIVPQTTALKAVEALIYCAAARGGAMVLSFPQERQAEALAIRLGAVSLNGAPKPIEIGLNGKPVPVDMHRIGFERRILSDALDLAQEALEDNDPHPLPAPVFSLVFPVVAHALLLPEAPRALRTEALELLAAHTGDDEDGQPILHRPAATVRLLLNTLANATPDLVSLAKPILSDVSRHLRTAEDVLALVDGVESEYRAVRGASLSGLTSAPLDFTSMDEEDASVAIAKLFIARFDTDESNKEIAEEVWVLCGLSGTTPPALDILPFLTHTSSSVRESAIEAFATSVEAQENGMSTSLPKLFGMFNACTSAPGRETLIKGLGACTPSLIARDLPLVSTFLTKVLSDEDSGVRSAAVETGRTMIDAHGAEHTQQLLAVYEAYFDRGGSRGTLTEEAEDQVRQGVVVFLGALAVHLDKEDEKVRAILTRLLEVLSTPSEAVQRSVADCLPPLMKMLSVEEQKALVDALLQQLTTSDAYADRRGAAFGLAGAVKGIGMISLKGMNIMDALKVAIEDKKNPACREGAVMAFELFCTRLGRLFEPYIVSILPMLLVCFGDVTAPVREATQAAARAIMANLSAQGVKLVLPALLCGVDDDKWRTKQGSVQLLGAMSSCAPKQLGACLPQIVPRLSKALIDTHPKVVDAAADALKAVGDVIRNPEIIALSNYLLNAIQDPTKKTRPCLDVLLETTFVNVVDAPSLALILPVLIRGLREPKADMKKKAAKIAGNLSSLVEDPKDMTPYIPMLVPELKKALVDPIPEVRGIAAQALAGLMKGLGEEYFDDLLPWMMSAMQSDGSSVERAGAAQGLSECLAVLSDEHFDALFPEILAGCSHASMAVREGHLTLLKFLPISLGQLFEAHLVDALACVLEGLADEDEPVRDAALNAGRVFVEEFSHSGSSLDLILPAIEDGIIASNWRIRNASVELLGSMLFRIIGSSGKVRAEGGDDADGVSTEAQGQMLSATLGQGRHHSLLAAVYILRSDGTLVVRNAAVHIWKTVVANTPKTLRSIVPLLMQRVISLLASSTDEHKQMASRCLGDVVRKLGERVLLSVLPIIQDGLKSEIPEHREGVALGLAEVLLSSTDSQLEEHYDVIIPIVRDALCDEDETVREAAGLAFDKLFAHGGGQAAGQIVPALLDQLNSSQLALEGLKQVLKAQPNILANVLPSLARPPLTTSAAHTLGALAEVAGTALPPHLPLLVPPLLEAMAEDDEESRAAANAAALSVIKSVPENSSHLLLAEIKRSMTHDYAGCRAAAAKLSGEYAKNAPGYDEGSETEALIKKLFEMFNDSDEVVLVAAWTALGDVTGTIHKAELPDYVECLSRCLTLARDKARRAHKSSHECLIPALCLPKGLAPIVQIFLQGILTAGSADARETATKTLSLAVSSTTPEALKAHIIAITGPLIRVVGDKHPSSVKSAILESLGVLIRKGGVALKPFVPQLQTTFVKCLTDVNMNVRMKAASAIGLLMMFQSRVDALVNDLISTVESDATEPSVRESTFKAIAGVFAYGGKNITAPNVTRAIEVALSALSSASSGERACAALALSRAFAWSSIEERTETLEKLSSEDSTVEHREAAANALCHLSRANGNLIIENHASVTLNALVRAASDDRAPSRASAARGLGSLIATAASLGKASQYLGKLMPVLSKLLRDAVIEVRFAGVRAIRVILHAAGSSEVSKHFEAFMSVLAEVAVADKSSDVRHQAERAVFRAFNLQNGMDEALQHLRAGGSANGARGRLSDIVLRQLAALPDNSDDDADTPVELDLQS